MNLIKNNPVFTNFPLGISLVLSIWLFGCNSSENDAEEQDSKYENTEIFRKVPVSESGVNFQNHVEERYETFFEFFAYVYNGGGVSVGDINNDGLPDLYFTGNEVENKLFLNKGNLKFEDITTNAGVAGNGWHNGSSMADINGDGWIDIYVNRGGWQDDESERTNLLYINNGDLTFKESAEEFGLNETGYSMQTAFFDFDNDNDLDAYVMNRPDSFFLPLTVMAARKSNPPEHARDKFYINEDGKFREIGKEAGITSNYGYGLGLIVADFNNDGFTDIFVGNDYSESDYLYVNQGNGTFKEQVKESMNHLSLFSMGSDAADLNNDGLEDILVMEMRPEDYVRSKVSMPSMDVEGFNAIVSSGMHKQYMHNMLHLNHGNLFFSEVSQLAGISKTDWSWSCIASDFDNDGLRDIFVSNGFRRDMFDNDAQGRLKSYVQAQNFESPSQMFGEGFGGIINEYKPVKVRNYLFHNEGDLKFKQISDKWDSFDASFSHGAVSVDLDNDGDLDLVVNNLEDNAFVYENVKGTANNFIKINLKGPDGNQFGLGAKISIYTEGKLQFFERKAVRGYLSSDLSPPIFGLGQHNLVDSILVVWPDGKQSRYSNLSGNQVVDIEYSKATTSPAVAEIFPDPIFSEVSDAWLSAPFMHDENEHDDYRQQILLPHRFSRNGPFIAVGDINGDNKDDFFVGGAAGQGGRIYVQQENAFVPFYTPLFNEDLKFEDMGAVLFDLEGDGDNDLYVVSGGGQFPENSPLNQDRLYINDGKGNFSRGELPQIGSSGSAVVSGDLDGDGDIDLIVGGQVVTDQYPMAPQSYILINEDGKLVDKTSEIASEFERIGMIKSLIISDLDEDGNMELIVAGEWMPIKVFSWDQGKLSDVSGSWINFETSGWWNELKVADIDGDGDNDLIAGNLGENYKFKATDSKPFQVYAKDFDGNGSFDIFLTNTLDDRLVPVRGLECSSQQMPSIKQKFPTYRAFANANISQIIGQDLRDALNLKAHLFSTVVLLNENNKFSLSKLPIEAQFSTVNSILTSDFDQDGSMDILIGGNHFDAEVETTPADSSPGFMLKSVGDHFEAVAVRESGFFIPYNVKDMKIIRLGNEVGIAVTSNNDKLRIFKVNKRSLPE